MSKGIQTVLIARNVYCRCPHCRKIQDGFIGDPRGSIFECVNCEETFQIHSDADIEMGE